MTLLRLPTQTILHHVRGPLSPHSLYLTIQPPLWGRTCTLQGLLVTKAGESPVILSQTIKLKRKSNSVAPALVTWPLGKQGLLKVIRPRQRCTLVRVSGILDNTSAFVAAIYFPI